MLSPYEQESARYWADRERWEAYLASRTAEQNRTAEARLLRDLATMEARIREP